MGLTALGAVAIDITLVALPAMAAALGGEPARSGLIITAFLAGFAPGQLSWGYVAERTAGGRP
jgi:MFS family permease